MTRSRRMVVVLGLWLVPALVPTEGLAAPAKGSPPPTTAGEGITLQNVPGLMVWVEPTVPEGERIGGWVEERGAQVLQQHRPSLEPEDLIRVAVRGGPYDYQIHFALLRNKRLLPDQPEVLVCECGSDEMLTRVGEAIGAGAQRLTDAAEAERAVAEQEAAERAAAAEREGDGKDRRGIGGLGWVGIGVAVLGGGALAAGIPLALREVELRGEPGTLSSYSTRPVGVGLAIGGSVALAAGVTLVVVDVVRRRERRVAMVPGVSHRHAGLSLVGKF